MKSISILGCGWLGERIGLHFKLNNWKINASSRKKERLYQFKNLGFHPFSIDIEDASTLSSDFFEVDFLIISTTNKNIFAHQLLFQSIQKKSIKKVFFISSTSVYQKTNEPITHKSALSDSKLVEIEKIYLQSEKTILLRCGGLIGDNRQPGNFFKKGATIKNPNGIVNLTHYKDIIAQITSLMDTPHHEKIYNLFRKSTETRFEFYSKTYKELHGESGKFKRL